MLEIDIPLQVLCSGNGVYVDLRGDLQEINLKGKTGTEVKFHDEIVPHVLLGKVCNKLHVQLYMELPELRFGSSGFISVFVEKKTCKVLGDDYDYYAQPTAILGDLKPGTLFTLWTDRTVTLPDHLCPVSSKYVWTKLSSVVHNAFNLGSKKTAILRDDEPIFEMETLKTDYVLYCVRESLQKNELPLRKMMKILYEEFGIESPEALKN